MIKTIYDDMWSGFCTALKNNQYELDPYLNSLQDSRRGITALAYLNHNSTSVTQQIIEFQQQLQLIDPSQYYYPVDDIHMTILSIISCVKGFQISDVAPQEYAQVFRDALANIQGIDVEFRGISASPSCIVIQGFPVGDGLIELRDKLRRGFKSSGLKSSFDVRYKLVTAHSTVARFCVPLQNSTQLMAICQRYRTHNFGTIALTNFELVFNDWYQRLSQTQSIAKYSI